MSGYIRRFNEVQTLQVIRQIEGVVVIDLAPPAPATGAGTGTVLLIGEFEDGNFSTDLISHGANEVYGSADFAQKFGGFGFTYGAQKNQNACARRRMQELWNGNGFLKAYKLRAQRLLIGRVDTSVGSVAFDPLASMDGSTGPFAVPLNTMFGFTTNTGAALTPAVSGIVATKTGASAAFGTILSGDAVGIAIDGGPVTVVTFSATDTTQAAAIARINATMGYACAVASVLQANLLGLLPGTAGKIVLSDVTLGALVKIGHTAGAATGTGNVANLNGVTVTELAGLINGSAPLTAIFVGAAVGANGQLRVLNKTSAAVSYISATAAAGGALLGFIEGAQYFASGHVGGVIPAGSRVTNGSAVWVTCQTLVIPAGQLGPYNAKVRPAFDDGTALGIAANAVNVLTDQPTFVQLNVRNAQALAGALTENQMDNAYLAAMDATLDESGVARDANYLLSARRSDTTVQSGKNNAEKATACGLFARIFITGDPLGTTVAQILANVARYRLDRVFYTGKGLKIRIPEIANQGLAGGLGFTADGIITVRPDGPLTTLCAILAPEENPGQETNLLSDFFEVDASGEVLSLETYKAFRAGGVSAPRVARSGGTIFQSGVTSSLDPAKINMARRKIADTIQNTIADLLMSFVKKTSLQTRRDAARSTIEQYLNSLVSKGNPSAASIVGFVLNDGVNAGNTPEVLAQGVYFIQAVVKTLSSLDDIVVQTEIGENAIITTAN